MPSASHAGPHLHEREITGAPAEIGDQDQLVMVELALELVCGSHGLVFEDDLVKPRLLQGRSQSA